MTRLRDLLPGTFLPYVNAEDLSRSKSISFIGGIQGKVSGMQITNSSGEPGASSRITIRGANSVYGGTTPLFVIDGVIMDMQTNEIASTKFGDPQTYDPLAFLNPDDIESVEVLKDASATAIYGSRGANGVIIVTTKSGEEGRTDMTFDAYYGVSVQAREVGMLSANEYIDYMREVRPNSPLFYFDTNKDGSFDENDESRDPYAYPQHNWQDEVLRAANSQKYSLSLNSGNKKTQYSGGLSYLNKEGLVINNDYTNYNMRAKIDHTQNKYLQAGVNVVASYTEMDGALVTGGDGGGYNGILQKILSDRPIDYYDPNESSENLGKYITPTSMINNSYKSTGTMRNNLNGYVKITPFNGLTISNTLGGFMSSSKSKEYYSTETNWGYPYNGRAIIQEKRTWSLNNNTQAQYQKNFNKHGLTAMVAYEVSKYNYETFDTEGRGFADESTGVNKLSKASTIVANSSRDQNRRMSYLARVNYKYADRYLLTTSIRRDGSDKFGPDHRIGYFPSVALGWRISEERFLKPIDVISNLKLRLSYGQTGNDRISSYQYSANMRDYYYNDQLAMVPYTKENPSLGWEMTEQYNMGLDAGFLDQRISLTFDLYKKITHDMLMQTAISGQTGFSTQWQNFGQITNQGVELQLTTLNFEQKDFTWATDITFSANKNIIDELGDVDFKVTNMTGYLQNPGRIEEGNELGTMYGYVFDGIYQIDDFTWQNNSDPNIPHEERTYALKEDVVDINGLTIRAPGSHKFKDLNNDGIIDSKDKQMIGYSLPKCFGGITNTFSYKNFTFSFFFDWSYGNDVMNEFRFRAEGREALNAKNVLKEFYDNRWTPENPTNEYGSYSDWNQTSMFTSSYYVEDASWIKLRNISLSYTLPKRIVEKMKLSNLRVYAVADNVYTWTKYSGFDPEVYSGQALLPGYDRVSYPRSTTYMLGVNIIF